MFQTVAVVRVIDVAVLRNLLHDHRRRNPTGRHYKRVELGPHSGQEQLAQNGFCQKAGSFNQR